MRKAAIVIMLALATMIFGLEGNPDSDRIDIFYKNKTPSLRVMERALPVVMEYADRYSIEMHEITSPETEPLIDKYNLPETHFPFAVVVNGHFSLQVDERQADLLHFPRFMHGIGRHEGNWSLDDLRHALEHPEMLIETNVPPQLPETDDDHCPE